MAPTPEARRNLFEEAREEHKDFSNSRWHEERAGCPQILSDLLRRHNSKVGERSWRRVLLPTDA